jgi:beta-xylosidase
VIAISNACDTDRYSCGMVRKKQEARVMSDLRGISIAVVLLGLLVQVLLIGHQTVAAQTAIPRKEDWYPVWDMVGDLAAHDPSIAEEDGVWWVFHTGEGLQVKSSDDGCNWTQREAVFKEPLSWWKQYAPKMNYNDVWAPDIEWYNGKWWLYYSVSEFGKNSSAIGLASVESIAGGGWVDHGMVVHSTLLSAYNAIDPNLFFDQNGDPWLVFGSWFSGIQVVRLDKETMKPADIGSVKTIARRRVGAQARGIEGPIITYKDGYYYLFASTDHCCQNIRSDYKIVVGRSRDVEGPYVDKNGVDLMNGGGTVIDAGNVRYNGVGGQDVFENRLLVRHGYDRTIRGLHVLLISDLHWDEEGWPVVCENEMNGFYMIQNKANGKYLTIEANSTVVGAKTALGEDSGHASFDWQIYRKEEGYYRIQNRHSLNYLEIAGASTDAGAEARMGSYENQAQRLWELSPADDGYYRIINKNSGMSLEALDEPASGKSSVVQAVDSGADSQLWRLVWARE